MEFADLARINGAFIESRILQTAVLLGIFDVLRSEPLTSDAAARRLFLLSNLIHGEDEMANQRLMHQIAPALRSGGRIVIKDHILDVTLTRPPVGAIFSVQMLLCTRGRDYSFEEVHAWLQAAGFTGITQRRLAPPLTSSLVVAVKP